MAYSETTIRARIKTVLLTVTNIGQVHDYERWADNWDDLLTLFKATVSGEYELRGWTVTLEDVTQEVITFQGGGTTGTVLVNYFYRVRGFLAVNDADASEKTMTALMLAAATALEADATLRSEALEKESPVVAAMHQEHRMFAGVLCHYVEMRINPQEVV